MPDREEPAQGGESAEGFEDREIARFQTLLLETLHLGLPPAETKARLLADPAVAPFAAWVADFDPRALEVAGVITRKFGVRRDPE